MPSIVYPHSVDVPRNRIFSLAWAVLFFVIINVFIALHFSDHPSFRRFPYHATYEDVRGIFDIIRHDPRRKIVFLGGSVMWGASSGDPAFTIPAFFKEHLPPDVSVYNLGLVAARPLDAMLIMFALRDSVDLFVQDYNYTFGSFQPRDLLLREPATYIHLSPLLSAHADGLFGSIPAMRACMQQFDLPLPATTSSAGEATLQSMLEHSVPIFHFKDRINERLFGEHPLLLIEKAGDVFGGHIGDLLDGSLRWSALMVSMTPEAELVNTVPWQPTRTQKEGDFRRLFQSEVFTGRELLDCQTRAFAQFAASARLPLVSYITPNNPTMFPELAASPTHRRNLKLLESQFAGTTLYDLDDQTFPGQYFTDDTHLTPFGYKQLADLLFQHLRPVLQSRSLLP